MFWFTVMAKINDACKNKNRISWAIANSDYTRENYIEFYDAMSKSIYIHKVQLDISNERVENVRY